MTPSLSRMPAAKRRTNKKVPCACFMCCLILIATAIAILYNGIISYGDNEHFLITGLLLRGQKKEKTMAKFECTVCGYIYDEEVGDPDNGIEPGTLFADLPDDWECPLCSVGKEDFEEVS